jgi:hypothetical protein
LRYHGTKMRLSANGLLGPERPGPEAHRSTI